MQVTINLPDKLTEKLINKWGNLPQTIINNLVLEAFREGLINFDELNELLNFASDTELKDFLKQKNILHSAGLLNLYGTCADIDFATHELGISPETDDDLVGIFDE